MNNDAMETVKLLLKPTKRYSVLSQDSSTTSIESINGSNNTFELDFETNTIDPEQYKELKEQFIDMSGYSSIDELEDYITKNDLPKNTFLSEVADMALASACKYGKNDCIHYFLEAGGNVNFMHENGDLPLMLCVKSSDNIDIIRLLLDHGSSTDVPSKNGSLPILEAVEKEWIECVNLLLEYGANVNCANPISLLTAALINARNGRIDILRLLTSRGADFNVATEAGVTPLMRACLYGHTQFVAELLKIDTLEINSVNGAGLTALMTACYAGYELCVKLLLEKGADLHHAKRSTGETALDLAKSEKIAKLINAAIDLDDSASLYNLK